MERLPETQSFNVYEPDEKIEDYLADFLTWLEEDMYSEIAKRVNWLLSGKKTIEAHTASDTLKENEAGSVHTNLGATGTITLTLPSSPAKGIFFHFAVQAAKELRIDPGAATIRDDSGQTADKYKTCSTIGECITLIADENGDWETISKYGTWTEEA